MCYCFWMFLKDNIIITCIEESLIPLNRGIKTAGFSLKNWLQFRPWWPHKYTYLSVSGHEVTVWYIKQQHSELKLELFMFYKGSAVISHPGFLSPVYILWRFSFPATLDSGLFTEAQRLWWNCTIGTLYITLWRRYRCYSMTVIIHSYKAALKQCVMWKATSK